MKKFITTWLTKLLGLEDTRLRVSRLELRAAADHKQIIELTRRMQEAEARLEQVEEQAAGHLERTTRVELQNLPVRYVADPVTGALSETR
jgi:hypothetical protein